MRVFYGQARGRGSITALISSYLSIAGWSSLVARRAHNPKVVGSNPAPATKIRKQKIDQIQGIRHKPNPFFYFSNIHQKTAITEGKTSGSACSSPLDRGH